MSNKMIVCNGREKYKDHIPPNENDPMQEFTLMVDHIIRFGEVHGKRFKAWIICRDMFRHDVQELWIEETPEQIRQMINDTAIKGPTDTEMLNWLDNNARQYGNGWICRDSTTGRGLRLHETTDARAKSTVRAAIIEAMKNETKS